MSESITYTMIDAIERRAKDERTPPDQLRADVQTLAHFLIDAMWRQTAADMALKGRAHGTHFAADVDAVVERERFGRMT